MKHLTVVLALVAAALVAMSAVAVAAPFPVLVTVVPTRGPASDYFRLSARPGTDTDAGTLRLVNQSDQAQVVTLDRTDALTTNTLGSAYALRGTAIHGASLWVGVSAGVVRIPAHGVRTVTVRVAVPRSATPGDYLTGVSVQPRVQQVVAGPAHGMQIGEAYRYAIGVEISLPGPRHPGIAITGADVGRAPGRVVFSVKARNTGNVILKNVTGRITVTRGSRQVAAATVGPGTFVTGTSLAYPVPAPRALPQLGTSYVVHATLSYAGGSTHLETKVRFGRLAAAIAQRYARPVPTRPRQGQGQGQGVIVWVLAGVLALLLLAILVAMARRRRLPGARRP